MHTKRIYMSKSYYVNRSEQSNGDHEVHEQGCARLPETYNRIYLGNYDSCSNAVREARKYYSQVMAATIVPSLATPNNPQQ